MADDSKIPTDASQNDAPAVVSQQPQGQVSPQQPVKVPEVPAGPSHPEGEPLPPLGNTEVARVSEPEPQLSEEVQEVGVTPVASSPVITPEQKEAGVEPAKESVPVDLEPQEIIHVPWDMHHAHDVMQKDKDVRSSLKWLATLIFRELEIIEEKKKQEKMSKV